MIINDDTKLIMMMKWCSWYQMTAMIISNDDDSILDDNEILIYTVLAPRQ